MEQDDFLFDTKEEENKESPQEKIHSEIEHQEVNAKEYSDQSILWQDDRTFITRGNVIKNILIAVSLGIGSIGFIISGVYQIAIILAVGSTIMGYISYDTRKESKTQVIIRQSSLTVGEKIYQREDIKKIEYMGGTSLGYQRGVGLRKRSTGHIYRMHLSTGEWTSFTVNDKGGFDQHISTIISKENIDNERNEYGFKHVDENKLPTWLKYTVKGAFYIICGGFMLFLIAMAVLTYLESGSIPFEAILAIGMLLTVISVPFINKS